MGARDITRTSIVSDRIGPVFLLLLLWLFFEFGRPPRPLGIPLIISVVACAYWLSLKNKQWSRHTPWWLFLLGVMTVSVPFSTNTYSAFWTTRGMAVLILCICLPLQAMVTSVKSVRWWAYSFLAVSFYVGVWAATHGGFGPSGADGGQDENYVAALMGMAVPFAYFSLFCEKRRIIKGLLVASIVVFVAAIALGQNPSRGGFLGLCAVGAYCFARSPRKLLGFGIFAVLGIALVAIAGPAFWAEIGTTTDYQSGTGDMRLEIWKAGIRMWEANPLFGVGPGNFRWVIGDYQSAAQFAKFGRSLAGSIIAHSLPIELLSELGLAGVAATGMLIWSTWTGLGTVRSRAAKSLGRAQPDAELNQLRCYADATQAAILAILVNGVFLSLMYFPHLWLLIALGSALPFVYRRLESGGGAGTSAQTSVRGAAVPAGPNPIGRSAAHDGRPPIEAGPSI